MTLPNDLAPQRIFVTGGSGFVGSAVIETLLARGCAVTALVHRGDLKSGRGKVNVVRGDLFSPGDLDRSIAGHDAVIHLVGIIRENPKAGVTFERIHFEGAKNVIDSAVRVGVKRWVHMSAMGARADAPSNYHRTKFLAEQALRSSGLQWTIFQPSLIHGPAGEFLNMEAAWARGTSPPFLFMPYFGGGIVGMAAPTKIQPVYVNDVARAFADALTQPLSTGKTYPLGGAQTLTWPQMHHLAAMAFTGHQRLALPIPAWYARLLTHIAPSSLLPFTRDQVIMAQEDSVGDPQPFISDFGWTPMGFEAALKSYAASVR